jgi:hypothetical protein
MRTRPFRFGSLKLTPLQIFFCVLLLIVIIVIVIFSPLTPTKYTLNIAYSGKGTGTVTTSPKANSTGTFDSGTMVTLTATPTNSSTFASWSGDVTGTGTIIMNSNKSVTATFNPPPPPTPTYAAVIQDYSSNITQVSYFSSLSSSSSKIINDQDHSPNVITQLQDKRIIVLDSVFGHESTIYTIDNGIYRAVAVFDTGSQDITLGISLQQINNGKSFIMVRLDKSKNSTIVYQSSSLNGPWVQLENFSNNIIAVSQSKDGKTFYCITREGVLYSFSNITDDFSKWTKITLNLANGSGNLNQIYSFTQLNDGSFIAIGPQGVLYQTTDPTLQTGWVLVNNNQQFISITEIIS